MDIITLAAFSISIVSLVVVIVSVALLRGQVTSRHHNEDSEKALEVSAIVSEFSQRMKRLEESLVDQKVKLEISELRVQRALPASSSLNSPIAKMPETFQPGREVGIPIEGRMQEAMPQFKAISLANPETDKQIGSTEREALRLVFEGRGRTTAKDIQQKIGRTREHTARMMNGLFQEGLVERDVTVRPFAYSITQDGRDLLNS